MTVHFRLSRLSDRTLDMFLSSVLENAPDSKLHHTVFDALLDEQTRRARTRVSGNLEPEIALRLPILPQEELEAASVGLAHSIAILEVLLLASTDDEQQFELAIGREFLLSVLDGIKALHRALSDPITAAAN